MHCQLSFHSKTKPSHPGFERHIAFLGTTMITQSCSNLGISKFFPGNLNCNPLRALVLPSMADSRNSLLELFLLQSSWMEKFSCSSLLLPWNSAWEWAQNLYIDLLTQTSQTEAAPAGSVSFSPFKEKTQNNTAPAELQLSEMVNTPCDSKMITYIV